MPSFLRTIAKHKIEFQIHRLTLHPHYTSKMALILAWFKKTGSIGEPVPGAITLEELERQLVTDLRRAACDRWWNSLIVPNDGTQTTLERQAAAMREKRNWWRWNFGEDMPQG
jgi:hypothetical protein